MWTVDAAVAHAEALNFGLAQVGASPRSPQPLQQDIQAMARAEPALPPAAQLRLADARPIWSLDRLGWDALSRADPQAFVRDVLAIAIGDERARERVYGPRQARRRDAESSGRLYTPSDGGALGRDPDSGCVRVSVPGGASFESSSSVRAPPRDAV